MARGSLEGLQPRVTEEGRSGGKTNRKTANAPWAS